MPEITQPPSPQVTAASAAAVLGSTVRRIVAVLLSEKQISKHIPTARRHAALRQKKQGLPMVLPPDNSDALRKLLKHNKRWVGRPVPIVARTLHPLWAVPVGPVSAAPIAACLLFGLLGFRVLR